MRQAPLLIILSFILLSSSAIAQPRKSPRQKIFLLNPDMLRISYWDDADLHPRDTTLLEVVYDLKYRIETISGTPLQMLTVLQVGDSCQKYYSMIRQLRDDVQMDVRQQIKKLPAAPGIGASHEYTDEERHIMSIAGEDRLNSEIWVDFAMGKLTERTHDYVRSNVSLDYEEPVPVFDWRFTEQADTVCGYPCFAASATFRGREWTVWYTPEIPLGTGPWKFNGLPGLVLRAQDARGDYVWECHTILQQAKPIVYYEVKRELLSRKKWERYRRQVHETPLDMLTEGGNCEIYIKSKLVTVEDNWQVPYNPIELE